MLVFFILFNGDVMKFISHRGNNLINYDNSFNGISEALNTLYIDGVEVDVRRTVDNHLVVFHDSILNFKSDDYGFIKNKKLKDVLNVKLDNGNKIFLFRDLLDALNTKKIIMIEVKDSDLDVDILYDIIKNYDFNFYIISFHYDFLVRFKKKYPQYKVGILIMFLLNVSYFHNDFDFNIVEYSYYKRISKYKEAFIFNVNDKLKYKKIYNYCSNFNIISDNIYLFR